MHKKRKKDAKPGDLWSLMFVHVDLYHSKVFYPWFRSSPQLHTFLPPAFERPIPFTSLLFHFIYPAALENQTLMDILLI